MKRFTEGDRFCISFAEDYLGESAETFNQKWAVIGLVKPYLTYMVEQLGQKVVDEMSYRDSCYWLAENTSVKQILTKRWKDSHEKPGDRSR